MATKEQLNERQSVVASLNSIAKFIHVFTGQDEISKVKVRYERLEEIWQNYIRIQTEIERVDCNEISKRMEFEETFYDTKAAYESLLPSGETHTNQMHDNKIIPHLKLPQINIPQFSGSYQEWKEFYDMFKSMIHDNKNLSAIQKFYYLRNSLQSEALQTIDSVPVTETNYATAFQLLCDRYDKIQFIVNSHMKSFFDQQAMTKESVSDLRRLITETKQHLRAMSNLGLPVEMWDTMVIYIVSQKLDAATKREWEFKKDGSKLPNLKSFYEFLEHQCLALEMIDTASSNEKGRQKYNKTSHVVTRYDACPICKKDHAVYSCAAFLKMNIKDRSGVVRVNKLCYNCLKPNCVASKCNRGSCKHCNKKHSSLLHYNESSKSEPTTELQPKIQTEFQAHGGSEQRLTCMNATSIAQVILPTARIMVTDNHGNKHTARALLDSASQVSFITKELIKQLGFNGRPSGMCIGGINQTVSKVDSIVSIEVASRVSNFKQSIECYILEKITSVLPSHYVQWESCSIPPNVPLADPSFNKPNKIDILLGADIYFNLLQDGTVHLGEQQPSLQNTVFGWVVAGKLPANYTSKPTAQNFLCTTINNANLSEQLSNFWRLEEVTSKPCLTEEEQQCERLFDETTTRTEDGRFIVKIPLKENPRVLGNSYTMVSNRLNALERRLERLPEMKEEYTKFLREYEELHHMEEVVNEDTNGNYIPHHAVLKETSTTTKLRVVFDASMNTTSGKSFNDIQCVGPVTQQDLIAIVLRFRKHKYVFTTDISKMYRQVLIHPSQTSLQRILWRTSKNENPKTYELKTVTYGTASAPYLATKCLQKLANDDTKFSLAAKILKRDFYVDDCLTGADTIQEALKIQSELIKLLESGGFQLRKWCANHHQLLESIPIEHQEKILPQPIEDKLTIRTLGLLWHPEDDQFQFAIEGNVDEPISKRKILSSIARIYDPLGLLGPVVVKAKLFMQELWQMGCDWDQELPSEFKERWVRFYNQLKQLNDLYIDRHVMCKGQGKCIEIHGFSDASERAYGAAVYIKNTDNQGQISVKLLCAKSRLAPIKQITLPRLELCAALLLSHLVTMTLAALDLTVDNVFLWTDSEIVMAWLAATPTKWKTFVANRVSEIQSMTKDYKWNHVTSATNPADMISRGLDSEQMKNATLWWNGPDWLYQSDTSWPINTRQKELEVPEIKPIKLIVCVNTIELELINKYSSWNKLVRVTAYVWRFVENLRKIKSERNFNELSIHELNKGKTILVKRVQMQEFHDELSELQRGKMVHPKSKLLSLSPFVDTDGIIRVGGRLRNANIPGEVRHPIVLPARHKLSKLIAAHVHKVNLHIGAHALLSLIRQQYWPLSGRTLARQTIHQCVICFRANPTPLQPNMGQLPEDRVQLTTPFTVVGIDYAGPLSMKDRKGRNPKILKCYICIFVCFASKAVHIELVTDLSTETFILALRRFVSRRGKPSRIYSDNGTNFVGANTELKRLYSFVSEHQNEICRFAGNEGIEWRFIPAASPHFGGLWEAGVKSIKHHLNRVMNNIRLTYEELSTLLVQIEAILNSRPLYPISNDPNDLAPLTPAHFLVNKPLTTIPHPVVIDIPENRLSKFQLIQQLQQHFWSRWSKEYISELQGITKWRKFSNQLKPDVLVVIKEDKLGPQNWILGRVTAVHPGKDATIRVATVRTNRGLVRRAVTKLCPLPITEDEDVNKIHPVEE